MMARLLADESEYYKNEVFITVYPGASLLIFTFAWIIFLAGFLLPLAILQWRRTHHDKDEALMSFAEKPRYQHELFQDKEQCEDLDKIIELRNSHSTLDLSEASHGETQLVDTKFWSVIRLDKESTKILSLASTFSLSDLSSAIFSSACLALIGYYAGPKQLTAFAEITLLFELTEEFLRGPIRAIPTVCANAIGASNNFLAGQYVQLSILLYVVMGIPFYCFWSLYTFELILWLGWGDEVVAGHAQAFVRLYLWSNVMDSISEAIGHLLDVTDHDYFTTIINIARRGLNVVIILCLVFATPTNLSLTLLGLVNISTSCCGLLLVALVGTYKRWLAPFRDGLLLSFAPNNLKALRNLLKVSVPLSFGSLVIHAEWAVLAVFAAHMGIEEVGVWSVLGFLFYLFESLSYGIGDAVEIQVALYIGEGQPHRAKLAAYKSLWLGFITSMLVTSIFISCIPVVPAFFTKDEELQQLVAATLPYMTLGYLTQILGYLCWYIVGATGRYNYGFWIHLTTSWCITLPLAALFVYHYRFDLQALTVSIVIGNVCTGCALAFVVFTTDWQQRADKVRQRHADTINNDGYSKVKKITFEGLDPVGLMHVDSHVSVTSRKRRRTKSIAPKNIILFVVPPGPLGLTLRTLSKETKGTTVASVNETSALFGRVLPGDRVIAIDGVPVDMGTDPTTTNLLEDNDGPGGNRQVVIMTRKRLRDRNLLQCDVVCTCYDFDEPPADALDDVIEDLEATAEYNRVT